jgi:hypothetical protein
MGIPGIALHLETVGAQAIASVCQRRSPTRADLASPRGTRRS